MGAIGIACGTLIDDLFDDIVTLTAVEGTSVLPKGLHALHELPPAYVDHYDPAFLRRFLTVTVDLSRQFLGEWPGLTCVAQELAMRLVLNRVAAMADQWDLDLEPDWQGIATEKLFWDIDHEFLYTGDYLSKEKSGLAEEKAKSNMWVGYWFEPFNDEGIVNLYASIVLDDDPTDQNGPQGNRRR